MMFKLYDPGCPNRVLHQEMTEKEANLRNGQLQRKGKAQRWIACECTDCEQTVSFAREAELAGERFCYSGIGT